MAEQDKVALYLYNCPDYLEASYAAYKIGLVPINTNYRYADDELVYLWENADAVAVVFHGVFVERIEGIRDRVPGIRSWLWVDDGTATCPPWAVPYEEAAETTGAIGSDGHQRVRAPWGRGPDDIHMLYTGGTTGMPKGVMWRQDDLFARLNGGGFRRYPPEGGIDDVRTDLTANGPGMTLLPACPLMHGTGAFTAMECLSEGGRVVTLAGRQFDPDRAPRHHRARAGELHGHRGRRLRQAHPGRPRRPPGPVEPVQPGRHHLLRCDVERGDQAGPTPPPPGHAPHRRLRLVRGRRHRHLGVVGDERGQDRSIHPRDPTCG